MGRTKILQIAHILAKFCVYFTRHLNRPAFKSEWLIEKERNQSPSPKWGGAPMGPGNIEKVELYVYCKTMCQQSTIITVNLSSFL